MVAGFSGVTVVVPTFRRPDGLRRLMKGLAAQVCPGTPWSVLVVDNDDPPGAEEVFSEAAALLPVPARLVFEPRRGASHARNRGIAEAEHPVVAFVDDDVSPELGWLAALLEPIASGRCDATGGRVMLDPAVPRPRWFHEQRLGPSLAAFDLGTEELELAPADYVLTANAAFTKATLEESGGFDPALGPRDGIQLVNDDVDLCRRVMAAGARLRYVPSALVVHDLPRARLKRRWLVRRLYMQGRSNWLLDREELATRRGAEAVRMILELAFRWARSARQGPWRRWAAHQMLWDGAAACGFLREAATAGRRSRTAQ
jgi:GT2 family glycosyltransferase